MPSPKIKRRRKWPQDAATGEIRPEIKPGSHQMKGAKGRTVILSTRIRREIGAYLKSQPERHLDSPLIISQRNRRAFSSLTLSMLFGEIYEIAGIRTSSHSGRRTFARHRDADNPKAHGAQAHRN